MKAKTLPSQHWKLSFQFALSFLLLLTALSLGPLKADAISPEDVGLKEGDLISSFVYDKDPDVFIVNQNGFKRLFLNQAIFNFYGHLRYLTIKLVKPDVKDQFITSSFYRDCEDNDPKVYGLEATGEDTGALHHLNIDGSAAISQDRDFFKKVFCVNGREFKWYQRGDVYPSLGKVPSYRRERPAFGPLSIIPASANLAIGESVQVKAMFTPPRPACLDATPPCRVPERVPYEVEASLVSSDPSVATVDAVIRDCASPPPGTTNLCSSYYSVRGIAAGSATITASYANSEGTFTAKMSVNVTGSSSSQGTLSIVPASATLKVGEAVKVRAIFTPPRPACLDFYPYCEIAERPPYEVDIALVSSDKSIAVSMCPPESGRLTCIGSNGVRGVSAGNAVITATYTNGSDVYTAQMKVTVISQGSQNLPPVISGLKGPTTLKVGETGTWTVQASDPENGSLSYQVVWGDEEKPFPTVNPASPSSKEVTQTTTFTHAYAKDGTFTPTFTVTDDAGLSAKTSASVKVGDSTPSPNRPPQITNITPVPTNIQPGQKVSFTWNATDPDNDSLAWSVNWGDGIGVGAACAVPTPSQKTGVASYNETKPVSSPSGWTFTQTHAWQKAGNYRVVATVSDCKGGTDSNSFTINVGNATLPFISFLSPSSGKIGTVVIVNGTNFTPTNNQVLLGGGSVGNTFVSNDGTSLGFAIPSQVTLTANCPPSSPCPAPPILPITPGTYKVSVSNANGTSNEAVFTVVASSPSITVTYPNGGETWKQGETYSISWQSNNVKEDVYYIDLINDAGYTVYSIIVIPTNPKTSYHWLVPTSIAPGSYRVRVQVKDGSVKDESDKPFSIVSSIPTLSVALDSATPIGSVVAPGQTNVPFAKIKLSAGDIDVNNLNAIQIASDSLNAGNNVVNARVYDGATPIGSIVFSLTFNGSYYYGWVNLTSPLVIPANTSKVLTVTADIPGAASGSVRLGIAGLNFNAPGAMATGLPVYGSVMNIASTRPSATVLSPNGGETWNIGSAYTIKYRLSSWTYPTALIYLEQYHPVGSAKAGDLNNSILIAETKDQESFTYVVPSYIQLGSAYKIKICNSGGCSVSDSSDGYFSVVS